MLLCMTGCAGAPADQAPATAPEREVVAEDVTENDPTQTAPLDPSRTWIVLLGTGTPGSEPDRFGPATAIVAGGTAYLIDAGPRCRPTRGGRRHH